jgi:hypothetical protein
MTKSPFEWNTGEHSVFYDQKKDKHMKHVIKHTAEHIDDRTRLPAIVPEKPKDTKPKKQPFRHVKDK